MVLLPDFRRCGQAYFVAQKTQPVRVLCRSGTQRGEGPGDRPNDQRGGEPAGPGFGGDHDDPVLAGRVDAGGGDPRSDPDGADEERDGTEAEKQGLDSRPGPANRSQP
jgi:hypothetical protein